MGKRGKKNPSLLEIRQDTNISGLALETVLKRVRSEGLPSAISRSSLRRQRKKFVLQETPFGKIVQHVTIRMALGTKIRVPIQHPLAWLWFAVKNSKQLRSELLNLMKSNNNRLRIALYSDDVTPGNALSANNARKIVGV